MFPIDNPCSLITASIPVMVGRGARSSPARESQAPEGGVNFCPLCVCTCTYVCVYVHVYLCMYVCLLCQAVQTLYKLHSYMYVCCTIRKYVKCDKTLLRQQFCLFYTVNVLLLVEEIRSY